MKPSQLAAEIVFLADSSSQVGAQNFAFQKAFIKNFARKLGILQVVSRFAMISYGSSPRKVFGLEDFRTFDELEMKVDNAPYLGGGRNIVDTLTSAKLILDRGNPRYSKVCFFSRKARS